MTEKVSLPQYPKEILQAIADVMKNVSNLGKGGENKFAGYKFLQVDDIINMIRPLIAQAGLVITVDEIESAIESLTVTKYDKGARREVTKTTNWLKVKYSIMLSHVSGKQLARPIYRTVMVQFDGAQAYGSAQAYVMKQFIRFQFFVATNERDDPDYQRPYERAQSNSGRAMRQGGVRWETRQSQPHQPQPQRQSQEQRQKPQSNPQPRSQRQGQAKQPQGGGQGRDGYLSREQVTEITEMAKKCSLGIDKICKAMNVSGLDKIMADEYLAVKARIMKYQKAKGQTQQTQSETFRPVALATDAELDELAEMAGALGVSMADVCKMARVNVASNITRAQVKELADWLVRVGQGVGELA